MATAVELVVIEPIDRKSTRATNRGADLLLLQCDPFVCFYWLGRCTCFVCCVLCTAEVDAIGSLPIGALIRLAICVFRVAVNMLVAVFECSNTDCFPFALSIAEGKESRECEC